jgi:hypothetical protein
MTKKILFLDLAAGIWPHSIQALKVLSQLEIDDAEILHVACNSAMDGFCPVRQSRKRTRSQIDSAKKIDCRDCQFSARVVGHRLQSKGFQSRGNSNTIFIDKNLSAKDSELVNETKSKIEEENFPINFEFFGAPVVRMALFEWILKFKKRVLLPETDEERRTLLEYVETALRFSIAGKELALRYPDIDSLVCHSPQYVANNAFTFQFGLRGIHTYFVSGSDNLAEMESSVMVWDWNLQGLTRPDLENWKGAGAIGVSAKELNRVKAHISQLTDGRSAFVYSAGGSGKLRLADKYQPAVSAKFTVLMTLSSLDEMIAIHTLGQLKTKRYPGTVFSDQESWVLETIEWFRSRPHLGLIVRIHPRELPNKRDQVRGQQVKAWEEIFENLPENVVLNHPSEQVPLDTLLANVGALVTSWSTTALQAILREIPVVTYDSHTLSFPADTHLSSHSKNQYFENLETVTAGRSLGDRDSVLAWLTHSMVRGSVQLTGRLFHKLRVSGPKWSPRILNGIDRYFYWVWRPLEARLTVKKTEDGRRLKGMILGSQSTLYD